MTAERVLEHLHYRLPRFQAGGWPERVGKTLNGHVWRVPGQPVGVVVKQATDASDSVSVDPAALRYEARVLELLGPDGDLAIVGTPEVRAPRVLDFDPADLVLVVEDAVGAPDLVALLLDGQPAEHIGRQLGRFTGLLHAHTRDAAALDGALTSYTLAPESFEKRFAAVGDLARRADVRHADRIGARAVRLGQRLVAEGQCLVVGDLRPAVVQVVGDGLRVADWSKAHYGSPAEDVGSLAAHLWMHIHRAPNIPAAVQASLALRNFIETYADTVAEVSGTRCAAREVDDCAVCFGVEVFMRTVGSEQDRTLYDRLPPDAPIIQDVVGIAARHIRHPHDVDMFRVLRED